MIFKKFKSASLGLGAVLMVALASCESKTGEQGNLTAGSETGSGSSVAVKSIIYSIPAPMEVVSLIKSAGAQFDRNLLNPVDKARTYTGESAQAVNLGIYGSDLSYASMFDQKQEAMNYLGAVQQLANALQLSDAFGNNLLERLETHQNNRDSLLNIVSMAYADMNDYLKENKREPVSAMVIAGGWIEGLYLATYYASQQPEGAMKQRVAEQKMALNNLIKLLESYNDTRLSALQADLGQLKSLYDETSTTNAGSTASKDEQGTVTIGGGATVNMTSETLQKIAVKIKEIRTKYVS